MPKFDEEPKWIKEEEIFEQKKAVSPDFSQKEWAMVDKIDFSIESKENLSVNLGKIARQEIINDPKALEKIYEHETVGEIESNSQIDANFYEPAGKGLVFANKIKKLFGKGSRHAIEGNHGLVDKRNLKEEFRGRAFYLNLGELSEVFGKYGLDREEINPAALGKRYNEKGSKTVFREKTEQEADQKAREVFEKQLGGLEAEAGGDLIKQKEKFGAFQKEKEKYKDILDEEAMAKLANEELSMEELIKRKQEALNQDLEVIRRPLEEHQKGLAETLEEFSALSKEAAAQAETYSQKINGLNDKINKIKGSKVIKEFLGDKINEWEDQKAQAEANKKAFTEKKQALEIRLKSLKSAKTEIDKTLTRINNIGKTKEELSVERAEKEKLKEVKKTAGVSQQSSGGGAIEPDGDVDEAEDETLEQNIKTEEIRPAAAKGLKIVKKINKKNDETDAAAVALGGLVASEKQPAEARQEKNEKIIMPVSVWLNLLGLGTVLNAAKTAVEKNFKIGDKDFNETASMNLDQVRQAYIGYIVTFRPSAGESYLELAQKEADEKLKQIIKNLS